MLRPTFKMNQSAAQWRAWDQSQMPRKCLKYEAGVGVFLGSYEEETEGDIEV